MIELTFEIKQTNEFIKNKIVAEISKHIRRIFKGSVVNIQKSIQTILKEEIENQPHYQSILYGSLKAELGIPDGQRRLENIVLTWLDSVDVKYKHMKLVGEEYSGGILIKAIDASFKDVLSRRDARLITEKGDVLEWLEWLLLEGDRVIVYNYMLGFGRGRAGNRIMLKKNGGSWSVPTEFSGTLDNNFVIDAVRQAEPKIQRSITEILNGHIS